MTNTTLGILCATLVLLFGLIVMLTAMGRDVGQLLSSLTVVLIPSIISLVGLQKADKAQQYGAETVHNTNGRMSHLISIIEATGGTVPPEYQDVPPLSVPLQGPRPVEEIIPPETPHA
jgi:hypothetical protein